MNNTITTKEIATIVESTITNVLKEVAGEENPLPTYDQLLLALNDLYSIGRRIGVEGGSWEMNMEQARNALQGAARNGKNPTGKNIQSYVFKGE